MLLNHKTNLKRKKILMYGILPHLKQIKEARFSQIQLITNGMQKRKLEMQKPRGPVSAAPNNNNPGSNLNVANYGAGNGSKHQKIRPISVESRKTWRKRSRL
jgi:hypothetical protein